MKFSRSLLVLVLMACTFGAFGQSPRSDIVTLQSAAAATGNGTALDVGLYGGVAVQITGTFSATVTFEATIDRTNWIAVKADNLNDRTSATTATAAGIFQVPLSGAVQFRARVSAYSSGSVTVKARGVAGQISLKQSSGGGGGGTVDSVFGRTGTVAAATNDYTWAQIDKTTSSLADVTTRSASDLSSGTLAAARGGAGTVNGLMKANGSGAVSAATAGTDYVAPGGALGTPSSGTLTNTTGLPVSTGISGLGTGIATALAVNIGSAGAPTLFNGAGGTPSSLTLTNATGLPPTTGISGWPANASGVLTNNGSGTLSWAAAGGGLTVGTTTVTSGTNTRILYNNAGVVGEYTLTGTGTTVAMQAGPTFTGTVAASAVTASGTIVQTSASATAFESGPNGSTNPVFRLVNSTANAATGLSITGNAAAAGVTVATLSSGTNENISILSKGSGSVILNSSGAATTGVTYINYDTSRSKGVVEVDNTANGRLLVKADGANGQTMTLTPRDASTGAPSIASNGSLAINASAVNALGSYNLGGSHASYDLFMRRAAAANLALGAADAAAPVAQTLSVQNVVAGTTNTAGANWTLAASRGTGTGAGGDVIIQTAPAAASTASTQNALVTAFTVKGNGAVQLKSVTNANLPTVANGYLLYCSDCTIASPCAGGGTGALAKGINGAWVCN